MGFTKEAFKAANAAGSGDFPTIPSGVYELEVVRMEIKDSSDPNSSSEQFSIGFKIDEDAAEYANQWLFYQQNIIKRDGMPNEIGFQNFNMMLKKLSAGQWSIDHFETIIADDGEEQIVNPEKVFDRFMGTKARFQVIHKEKDGYDNYVFKMQSLLKNTYNDAPMHAATENGELEENVAAPDTSEEPQNVEAEEGQRVIFENAKGNQEYGTIIQFVESQDPNLPHMIMIQPDGKTKKPCAVIADKVRVLIEPPKTDVVDAVSTPVANDELPFDSDELELEEEPELKLIKGATVKASYNGSEYTGKVHSIDEAEGTLIVAFEGKGRRHKIADVTVVSN